MKEDLQLLETIDNYLNDRMSQEERIAFEQKMASDISLAQKVEEERSINEAIHFANLAELRASVGKEIKDIKYTSGNPFNKYLISGLIILGTGVSNYIIVDKKEVDTRSTKTENAVSKKETITVDTTQEPVTDIYIPEEPVIQNTSAKKEVPKVISNNERTDTSETKNLSINSTSDKPSQEVITVSKPIVNTQESDNSDTPIQTEAKEPKAQSIINSSKQSSCNQSFTFLTKPSCQNNPTGTIAIQGNLNQTFHFKLDNVLTFPTNGVFNNVSAGKHEIVIKYQDSCEYIETLTIDEEWCSLNHSFSFNPEYGEKWELLYSDGSRGSFIILNNVGKELYQGEFGVGKCFWNGSDKYGSIVPTGIYLAIINHSDGRKEKVELTIVR